MITKNNATAALNNFELRFIDAINEERQKLADTGVEFTSVNLVPSYHINLRVDAHARDLSENLKTVTHDWSFDQTSLDVDVISGGEVVSAPYSNVGDKTNPVSVEAVVENFKSSDTHWNYLTNPTYDYVGFAESDGFYIGQFSTEFFIHNPDMTNGSTFQAASLDINDNGTIDRYLALNPDLLAAGFTDENPMQQWHHFRDFGAREARLLDISEGYLTANPDLVVAGFTAETAIDHYLNFGKAEGRHTNFEADVYLHANPDLAAAGYTETNAFEHFQAFGRSEGRIASFDEGAYVAANPDTEFQHPLGTLIPTERSELQLLDHWLLNGQFEGRAHGQHDWDLV